MTKKSNSHFKHGSGVFKCQCCGHNTRQSGQWPKGLAHLEIQNELELAL